MVPRADFHCMLCFLIVQTSFPGSSIRTDVQAVPEALFACVLNRVCKRSGLRLRAAQFSHLRDQFPEEAEPGAQCDAPEGVSR